MLATGRLVGFQDVSLGCFRRLPLVSLRTNFACRLLFAVAIISFSGFAYCLVDRAVGFVRSMPIFSPFFSGSVCSLSPGVAH